MAEATRLKIAIDVSGIPELSKLRAAIKNVENSSKVLGTEFGRTRQQLKLLEQSVKPSINSTRALRDSFKELANQTAFGSKQFAQATREAERLDKQLQKMEKRTGPRFGGMRGVAQTVGTVAGAGVFGGPEGAAGALIGAGVGGPAGAIVGGAIGAQVGQMRQALGATAEYAAGLTKLRIALEGVSATQGEYQRGLAFITQSTKDFAIPQSVLTKQFTKLQASVSGAGGTVKDTEIAFKGIVAAVRATGGSLQDVDSALTATAQVFSKGKVSAEELRQQIGERLPGAFTLFAESMGKTPAELDKALEKGEVTLEDFQRFAQAIFERYGETAKEIANGPEAAGDRLKVVLEELNEETGKLLKPIGASFQSTFEDIATFMTKAVRKVNEFKRAVQEMQRQRYKQEIQQFGLNSPAGRFAQGMLTTLEEEMGLTGGFIGPELPDRFLQTDFGGNDGDGDGSGSGTSGRKDISTRLLQAQEAALRATNEKRKVALELEAKLIKIEESSLLTNEKQFAIIQASVTAKDKLAAIDKKEDERREKRRKELEQLFNSFKVKSGGFDFSGIDQGEGPKTPFEALRAGADEFTDSLKGTLGAAKELATVGLQGISDGITNLVVNGTLNFREFAASLLRDMARIIMQQVVMKSLMQAIGFGTNTVEKTDYTKFFTSQPGDFPIPKFANGGITRGVSIAGEAGPEAIVPLPDGRTIPVKMQGEGAKVIVNVDAQGTTVQGDTAGANRLGEAIGTAVRQELLKQKRPGGLLA